MHRYAASLRRLPVPLALAPLASCGGDASGPLGLTTDRINGDWSSTLTRTHECPGALQAATLPAAPDFTAGSDVANTVASTWRNDPAVPDRFGLKNLTFVGTAIDPIPATIPPSRSTVASSPRPARGRNNASRSIRSYGRDPSRAGPRRHVVHFDGLRAPRSGGVRRGRALSGPTLNRVSQ